MSEKIASLEEIYLSRTPRSRELYEQSSPYTAGPIKGAYFYPPYPVAMDRAEGCYLYDLDSHRYVDFANHHTAQILGHNHPSLIAAVEAQMKKGLAVGAPMGAEAEIAAEMCRRVASVEGIRFVNSGTEATLHAIRLARGFSKKPKIAKFEGGYHGSHDPVEVSSSAPPPELAGPPNAPNSVATAGGLAPNVTSEVLVLPYNDEAAVEKLVEQHREELACVIFDPKAGTMPLRPEFVRAVREITRKNDVLLIFDEIVGFRTGTGGLQAYYGIDPDLTCFGKILGGGFAVGAFGGRADVMGLFDTSKGPTGFSQSGTFSAHPITMTAGLAVLKELTPQAFDHLNGLNDRLCDGLNDLFARRGTVAQAVGVGSVFSIYFVDGEINNERDLARSDGAKAFHVFLGLLEEGYFLGHTLTMCCLSLPMEESHIDGLIEATGRAVERS